MRRPEGTGGQMYKYCLEDYLPDFLSKNDFNMGKYLKLFANHTAYSQAESSLDKPNVAVCLLEGDVHYNPYDPFNGYAYVDLGLPSGTKWATMNVGANNETDYGLYFAWGETQGYTAEQVGTDKQFRWSDYKFNPSGDGSTMSKYNSTDGKTVLDLEDDAVRANWGGSWRMPTETQFQELLNTTYVTNTFISNYQGSGINGRLFTSVTNGNTLFIPAAGGADNGSMDSEGVYGYVWSSSLNSSNVGEGCYLSFYRVPRVSVNTYNRCGGSSVRGVVSQ